LWEKAVQTSFSELEYAAKRKRMRRDRFLSEIEAALRRRFWRVQLPRITRSAEAGRPPIGLERMLRVYVAQQCLGLSDEETEDALFDNQAIRHFVGIDLNREAAPDATTLLRFRRLLESHQLTESIFNAINAHLAEKGNQWYFGMKAHIGVDAQSGLVHTVIGTAANVSDVTQTQPLLHGDETDVFCDAGYQGVEKREENLELPVNWHVAMRPGKRKALPKTTLGKLL
jgi:IS5 family transposase